MTDEEILELIYDNPVSGVASFIDTYAGLVCKIVSDVLSGTGDETDIEECVTDTFVAFCNNIDDVDLSMGSLKGYLGVIAKRRAVNLYYTIRPDDDTVFDEHTVEEMSDLLENETSDEIPEFAEKIISRCLKELSPQEEKQETEEEIPQEKPRKGGMVLKRVIVLLIFIAVIIGVAVTYIESRAPEYETTTTTQTTTQQEKLNPLLSAIMSGNEQLIEGLIENSLLISQDVLSFAVEYADKISYDSIRKIAEEVRNKYGSTGLDPILDSAIFGDFRAVRDKLKEKDESDMTPAERLAYFFATAFDDSAANTAQ